MRDDGGLDFQNDGGHGEKYIDLRYNLEVEETGELMKYICVKVKGERIKQDSDLWSGQRRQWHPTPVLLPGKSRRQRSLVGCGPWGREESDTTEQLHLHFSLSCIGEGNGNPLQCSCLENPRNRGAWWAALYGAAQSWTQLRRPSSSSMVWVTGWGLVHACRLIHFGCV